MGSIMQNEKFPPKNKTLLFSLGINHVFCKSRHQLICLIGYWSFWLNKIFTMQSFIVSKNFSIYMNPQKYPNWACIPLVDIYMTKHYCLILFNENLMSLYLSDSNNLRTLKPNNLNSGHMTFEL